MSMGDKTRFAWAMSYKEAVRCGLSKQSFFDDQRKHMKDEKFAKEILSGKEPAPSGTMADRERLESGLFFR